MLHVVCPSCGERGKIPADMVGTRIKCKKCGVSFQVAAPVTKTQAAPPAPMGVAVATSPAPPGQEVIDVEGLDAASWAVAPDQSSLIPSPTGADQHAVASSEPSAPSANLHDGAIKEYKILTSRDKIFAGKFDLSRLEEVINQFARQGWTAKYMCLPHIKNFQGALQEELVVLMER